MCFVRSLIRNFNMTFDQTITQLCFLFSGKLWATSLQSPEAKKNQGELKELLAENKNLSSGSTAGAHHARQRSELSPVSLNCQCIFYYRLDMVFLLFLSFAMLPSCIPNVHKCQHFPFKTCRVCSIVFYIKHECL